MKERFIENGIEYVKHGDYYLPNLTVPDDKVYNIGKYGRLHAKFIKENYRAIYSMKMLNGTWLAYLEEIDNVARETYFNNYRQKIATTGLFILDIIRKEIKNGDKIL